MLATWNASPTWGRLLDEVMNDVMGSALGTAMNNRAFSPDIDVRTKDDEIFVVLDVPGLKREDLDIEVENEVLTIKGQRKYEFGKDERVMLGRGYGAFTRSLRLPDYADVEHLSAELADGVLTIRVPKQAKAKPRRIEIRASGERHKQLSGDSSDDR